MNFKISLLSALILFSCKKDDDSNIKVENVEIYSNEYFKSYIGNILSSEDSELALDESLIIVGNGNQNGSFNILPFYVKVENGQDFQNLNYFASDGQNIFRKMDLLPLQDGNYIYLSTIDVMSSNSLDVDLRKLSKDGETIWQKRFGNSSINEKGTSIIQLPNNDFIIIGTVGEGFGFPNQYFLSRVSKEGEAIWSKNIEEGSILGSPQVIYLYSDNSLFVLNENPIPNENGDVKVTKFDVDGNVLSSKLFESSSNHFPYSSGMKILANGNALVYFSSSNSSGLNNMQVRLFSLNSNLEEQWSIVFKDISHNIVSDVAELPENEFLILSKSSSIGNGEFDVVLSKIDFNGTSIWNKVYGSSSSDQGHKIHQKMNKDLLIVGNSNHDTGSEMKFNTFILTTDADGNPK